MFVDPNVALAVDFAKGIEIQLVVEDWKEQFRKTLGGH